MNERRLPPYPPARNAWEYPPPPISRRWIWAPIAAVTVALIAGVGLIAATVVINDKDFPSTIEDQRILSVIRRECDIMTETVKSMPIKGTAIEQAQVVTDQNTAITNMLTQIRKIGDGVRRADPPTNAWLDDWDALVVAREAYAETVLTPICAYPATRTVIGSTSAWIRYGSPRRRARCPRSCSIPIRQTSTRSEQRRRLSSWQPA